MLRGGVFWEVSPCHEGCEFGLVAQVRGTVGLDGGAAEDRRHVEYGIEETEEVLAVSFGLEN